MRTVCPCFHLIQNTMLFILPNTTSTVDDISFWRDEACSALCTDDEQQLEIYNIMANELHYPLQKRNLFYHILVFNYFELSEMDKINTVDILTHLTQLYNPKITRSQIDNIVYLENVDGQTLQRLVQESSFNELTSKFRSLSLRKVQWRKIWEILGNWEDHAFELQVISEKSSDTKIRSIIKARPLSRRVIDDPNDGDESSDSERKDEMETPTPPTPLRRAPTPPTPLKRAPSIRIPKDKAAMIMDDDGMFMLFNFFAMDSICLCVSTV